MLPLLTDESDAFRSFVLTETRPIPSPVVIAPPVAIAPPVVIAPSVAVPVETPIVKKKTLEECTSWEEYEE
jgi:hypothetical protein